VQPRGTGCSLQPDPATDLASPDVDLPPLDQLVVDDVWGTEHARFLHLVFVEFDRSGEWPVLEELVRKVARAGEKIDLYHEVRGLPPSLGRLEGERVTLMVSRSQASRSRRGHSQEFPRLSPART